MRTVESLLELHVGEAQSFRGEDDAEGAQCRSTAVIDSRVMTGNADATAAQFPDMPEAGVGQGNDGLVLVGPAEPNDASLLAPGACPNGRHAAAMAEGMGQRAFVGFRQ
jgi:hypothetical protein